LGLIKIALMFQKSNLVKFLVKFINTKNFTKRMAEVIVTRGGQITLTKDVREKLHVREGDMIIINVLGDTALITKRNPKIFEKHDFLPENYPKTLKNIRSFSWEDRLKRLGVIG